MTIQGFSTQEVDQPDQAAVVADVFSPSRADRAMQELMSRIQIEPGVTTVHWQQGKGAG